jgi:hypothetical protein
MCPGDTSEHFPINNSHTRHGISEQRSLHFLKEMDIVIIKVIMYIYLNNAKIKIYMCNNIINLFQNYYNNRRFHFFWELERISIPP